MTVTTFLTLSEVADRLQISTRTVQRMIDRDELKAVKVGPRLVRVPDTEIARLLTDTDGGNR
jgi:excisionase family DNA binding protein